MKKMKKFVLFLSVALNFALANDLPIVTTQYGKISGVQTQNINAYLGIPYAKAPLGELRWMPPLAPDSWDGVKNTSEFANQCLQGADLGIFAKSGGSEDCLYLNIFTPKTAKANANLPVLFWIHGGGLMVGSGNAYDPETLVKNENIVVVTINYRLGSFGFLANSGLNSEKSRHTNYGFMDQAFALEFVKNNIKSFGGNPNNITVAGESSGAHSVFAQIISPYSKSKFKTAITMSGANVINSKVAAPLSLDEALNLGNKFAKILGCDPNDTKCLRKIPAEKIVAMQSPYIVRTPIIDGDFLPVSFANAFSNDNFENLTLINGSNLNEGTFFSATYEQLSQKLMSDDDYETEIKALYGDIADDVLKAYPLNDYANAASAYASAFTDSVFACPALNINETLSPKISVFAYEFADETAPSYLPPNSTNPKAAHTFELAYIFDDFKGGANSTHKLNEFQVNLSKQMGKIWANASNLQKVAPKWSKFDTKKQNFFTFALPNSKIKSGEFRKAHKCEFWQNVDKANLK